MVSIEKMQKLNIKSTKTNKYHANSQNIAVKLKFYMSKNAKKKFKFFKLGFALSLFHDLGNFSCSFCFFNFLM